MRVLLLVLCGAVALVPALTANNVVLSVLTFRTPAEAISKANNTPYGLSAGIWSDKGSKILAVADKLRAGVAFSDASTGGLLTFESEWSPALGPSMDKALNANLTEGRLDIGCVAAHGHFFYDQASGAYSYTNENKPATAFLFKLIAQLQFSGTVPMIDVEAYGQWLTK